MNNETSFCAKPIERLFSAPSSRHKRIIYGIGFSHCAITLPKGEHPICTDKPGEWTATICLPDGSPAKEIRIIRRKSAGNAPEYEQ